MSLIATAVLHRQADTNFIEDCLQPSGGISNPWYLYLQGARVPRGVLLLVDRADWRSGEQDGKTPQAPEYPSDKKPFVTIPAHVLGQH